jgi:hypothetical protein
MIGRKGGSSAGAKRSRVPVCEHIDAAAYATPKLRALLLKLLPTVSQDDPGLSVHWTRCNAGLGQRTAARLALLALVSSRASSSTTWPPPVAAAAEA